MFHTLAFVKDHWVDLQRSAGQPLERVLLRRGTHRRARLQPRIVETGEGPVEVADLFFEDGSFSRSVPFAVFHFPE